MKPLSTVFGVLAFLLSNLTCVVVTYNCTVLYYVPGNSAPWDVGFLLGIPYAVAAIACACVAYAAKKKGR